ncbi:MAG TPA: hypothetical protein VFF67_04415 [Thermoplasmata archaeon]|nr:hypothetical protein [Thermoplasmata archaeon]
MATVNPARANVPATTGTSQAIVRRFLDELLPFRDIWVSAEILYSAFRVANQWYNLSTRILLSARDLSPMRATTYVDIPDLVAGKLAVSSDKLSIILDSLVEGHLEIGSFDFLLASPVPGTEPVAMNSYSWWTGEGDVANPQIEIRFGDVSSYGYGFTLLGEGEQLARALDAQAWARIGRRMIAGDPPVIGFEDLAASFLRRVSPFTSGHHSSIVVIAPLYARFGEPEFVDDNRLSLSVSGARGTNPADYRLVVRKRLQGDLQRENLRLDKSNEFGPYPSDVNDIIRLAEEVEIAGVDWIGAHLLFRDFPVDVLAFPIPPPNSPNPRIRVLQALDVGDERVRELLSGDKKALKDDERFEIGVSWILQFCGFQVLLADFRKRRLSEGGFSDIIAFVPLSQSAMICEATLDNLAADGKLVKLAHRVESAGRALEDSNIKPLAVIVTANQLVTRLELDQASALRIAVLSLADLQALYDMADRNETAKSCFEFIQGRLAPGPAT